LITELHDNTTSSATKSGLSY